MTTTLRGGDILFNDSTTQATTALNAVAASSVGAVGTYGFFKQLTGANQFPGNLVAGSNLLYSNVWGTGWFCYTGTSPAGTWRCAGYARYNGDPDRVTLFFRVS